MELRLTCSHELNSNVDIPVTVLTVWRRGGQVLTSSGRVNVSTTSSMASSLYQATLLVRPTSSSLDTGVYSCQSSITSEAYVIYEQGSAEQTVVTVLGINLLKYNFYHQGGRLPVLIKYILVVANNDIIVATTNH